MAKTTMKTQTKQANKKFKEATKLWQILEIALSDLKACERIKNVVIDMGTWHQTNGKCSVCLAGSVMHRRFASDCKKFYENGCREVLPDHFDDNEKDKFSALNYIREGSFSAAFEKINRLDVNVCIPLGFPADTYDMPNYDRNKDNSKWWAVMEQILAIFKTLDV